eukprot:TRINITY_DN71546_c0_g1_i1.p1 TRINITY_DN71546_c0_g1~~TRINITY_DN71546_c0_g1_i1.p1  ORF type:complete len:513 (+),score=73.43 TRINITY_DN71546_c0_g1_i1:205-1743(+)
MSQIYERSPFKELFLTLSEKDQFATWKEVIIDRSYVNRFFAPLFSFLASLVPSTVAPNVITLSGCVAMVQAWYFCENYSWSQPYMSTCVSIVSISIFWLSGGIDGVHARRTMNDTSLGELFKYVCDMISSTFLVVVLCELLGEMSLNAQWYCVQTVQLVFLLKHHSAFTREAGLRYLIVGPGELICCVVSVLTFRAVFGLSMINFIYNCTWGVFCSTIVQLFSLDPDGYIATMSPARAAYLSAFYLALARIAFTREKKHRWTHLMLSLILILRGASGALRIDVLETAATTKRCVIFDGLFLGMVTSDLIVAKMAGREIHPWVVVMASMVVLPHLQFLTLCFVVCYYIAVFADLMFHENLPLLQVVRNVYCDGIYDLCHVGHKNLFRKALTLGNRLFVGVIGDEDANNYKRPPVMSAAEREAEVASCKCVTKVIQNAPCFGLTEEFIRKHRIHVVAFGQEYMDRFPNPDDDPYYKVPRKMGIAQPMPRTEGLSTSDLIRRIQQRGADEKKSPT